MDWAQVVTGLRADWSPEQIAGRLARERILTISHETIYRYVWADKAAGGQLFTHLRCARKHCRKRYGAYDSRGRLAGNFLLRPDPSAPRIARALLTGKATRCSVLARRVLVS